MLYACKQRLDACTLRPTRLALCIQHHVRVLREKKFRATAAISGVTIHFFSVYVRAPPTQSTTPIDQLVRVYVRGRGRHGKSPQSLVTRFQRIEDLMLQIPNIGSVRITIEKVAAQFPPGFQHDVLGPGESNPEERRLGIDRRSRQRQRTRRQAPNLTQTPSSSGTSQRRDSCSDPAAVLRGDSRRATRRASRARPPEAARTS